MEKKEVEKEKVRYPCQCGATYSQPQSLKRHQENNGCAKKRKYSEPQPQPGVGDNFVVLQEEKSQEYRDLLSDLTCCPYYK